jgi:hypothetical protein
MKVIVRTYEDNGKELVSAEVGNTHWESFAEEATQYFFGAMVAAGFAPQSVYTSMIDFLAEAGQLNLPENETD